MQWLAAISVKRPVFATVLILVLSVVGLFAYLQLGIDRFPKIDFPAVVITTVLRGAAPEEVETEVSDKLESAVNTISGIDELRSVSSEGVSVVIVTFVLENLTSSTFYDVAHGSGEVRFSGGAPHRIVSANWCARPPTPGGSTCTSLLQEVDSGRTRTVSDVRLDAPIVRFALDAKSVGRDWSTYGTIIVR